MSILFATETSGILIFPLFVQPVRLTGADVILFSYFLGRKDCELQLASYSSGLETLLNIPIKRTMLQSPATVIAEEVFLSRMARLETRGVFRRHFHWRLMSGVR